MNLFKNIPRLITIIIVSLIWCIPVIFLIKKGKDIGPALTYWRKAEFKTDTLYITKYQPLPVTAKEPMPPKEVIVYQDKPIPTYVMQYQDSLVKVIDRLKRDTIEVKPPFLTLYPKADKLISAYLTKDTLSFDLLDRTGMMKREVYQINSSQFNYQYRNSSMFADELKTTGKSKQSKNKSLIRYNGVYLNFDRDLLNRTNKVNADIGLEIWKLRVQGYAETGIKNPFNDNRVGARVGYRLF